MPTPEFIRRADLPAVVGQFLGEVGVDDLVAELIQNELDAHSRHTDIFFGANELICEGDGEPINEKGWERLECILGAGGEVEAKLDGIGAKNHGLRTGFRLGDEILVQSAGLRVRLSLFSDAHRTRLDPGVWAREPDPLSPRRGTRITIRYRDREVAIPSGEGFTLPATALAESERLYLVAVDSAPSRFIGVVPVDIAPTYRLTLRHHSRKSEALEFLSTPSRTKPGSGRRTCSRVLPNNKRQVVLREEGAIFPIRLLPGDTGKVAWPFRCGRKIIGEIAWSIDGRGRPVAAKGCLRYPIGYPLGDTSALSGHGFHISSPFVSDTGRHGVSGAHRNRSLRDQSRVAFVNLLSRSLLEARGSAIYKLLRWANAPDVNAERAIIRQLVEFGALAVEGRPSRGKKRVLTPLPDPMRPFTVASLSWTPGKFEDTLTRIIPSGTRLVARRTPSFLLEGLVALAQDMPHAPIRHFTESDAIAYLAPDDSPNREKRKAEKPNLLEFKFIEGSIRVIQACVDANRLSSDQQSKLKERGLLPTRDGPEAGWKEILFWRDAVPTIGGLPAPRIVDTRLSGFRMLREGSLRLTKFKLKDYLLRFNFAPAAAVYRKAFFQWLRQYHSRLEPGTLARLADFPVWPSADNRYVKLSEFCYPAAPALRALLSEVTPPPADEVLNFPGPRRNARGALHLRKLPSEEELEAWYTALRAKLDETGTQGERLRILDEIEAGLLTIRRTQGLEGVPQRIARDHISLTQASTFDRVADLHIPVAPVIACELLPDAILAGRHTALYEVLDARQVPCWTAVGRALLGNPVFGELFSPRLAAYIGDGGDPAALSAERIIPLDGSVCRPEDLKLTG